MNTSKCSYINCQIAGTISSSKCPSLPSNMSIYLLFVGGCCGIDRMVVGFITTCAISAYHHKHCEFEPRSWRGVLDTTLHDKVCQWFSQGTPVSSTSKTDRHDILEIFLKVELNTIKLNLFVGPVC